MKKKILISLGIVSVILVVAIALKIFVFTGGAKIDARDYNLLVITLDTTRADHIGAYGYKSAQTPHIDSLARNGVMFSNCYTPVPLTLAAHSSLFTGKYPLSHQVRDNGIYTLAPGATLAGEMKTMNYQTFAVIASFVLLSRFGLNQGFDFYDDSLNSHVISNNYASEIPASIVYLKFLQWFEKNYDRRFFAWVHLYDPHEPYTPPKEYAKKFSNDSIGRYDGEIAFADDCVGKIIDDLKTRGILDKTVVVVVGDHGEGFGEHGEYGHGIFCYEETLNVPLIFYNERLLSKGRKIENRVNLVDIMPTILELYGINTSTGMDGKSFALLLAGEREKGQREFYFESMHGKEDRKWAPLMGILDDKYKYVSLPEPELYDLEADRGEKRNLFWKMNRMARDMDRKLMKFVATVGKPVPGKDSRRELTEDETQRLKSLGYISSFSGNNANVNMDPKKGIHIENKMKAIYEIIGKGNFDEAKKEINSVLSQYPEIATAPYLYDIKHQLYSKMKDTVKTLETLKEAMDNYPKEERFYILFALALKDRGRIEDAENYCRKVLGINPGFTPAYITMGEIEEKRGNLDNAIKNYEKAVGIEPHNISLKIKYAELLVLKGDIQRALSIYDELLERDEVAGNAELLFKIAILDSQFGAMEKTERLLKQAIDIDPKGKYYFNYSLALAKNQKLREALENMEIVLDKYRSGLNEQQLQVAQKAVDAWKQQF